MDSKRTKGTDPKTHNLTDRMVKGLSTGEVQETFMDSNLTGFGVRVTQRGVRTFFVRYRTGGKRRRYKIGRYPALSLADARDMARDLLGRVARGEDPAEERRQRRAEIQAGLTFHELADLYIQRDAMVNKRDSTWKEEKRILLNGDVEKTLGSTAAGKVSKKAVVALLDAIMARGSGFMANRTRAAIMAVYKWAISRPETGITLSPVWGTRPPLRKEYRYARDRILSPEEILQLWELLEDFPWRPASILHMILLTGQRPGEVCSMEWKRIQGDLWTMPAAEYKGGHAHHVVLTSSALKILDWARDYSQGEAFVFPGDKGGPYRTRSLDQTVSLRILPKMDVERWTPHDLRRTSFTQMGALGISRQIRDRIAGHSDPSVGGRHYDHHDYLPEIREAMEQWGKRVEEILDG